MRIHVGTRPSRLALQQVKEVQNYFPATVFETVVIMTRGDRDKKTPLDQETGSDFFTDEIEDALLDKKIDVAIHSAKDLQENMPQGLSIAAFTRQVSPYDCLVSRDKLLFEQLPSGSVIGTSSRNRRESLGKIRPDLVFKEIRGNVDDRIAQLRNGDFQAIVVAHAALIRLGVRELISQIFPYDVIRPHPLQGRLAVQIRTEDFKLRKFFKRIDHDRKE